MCHPLVTDEFNHEKLDSVPQSVLCLSISLSAMLSAAPPTKPRAEGYLLIVEKNLAAFEDRPSSFLQGKWKEKKKRAASAIEPSHSPLLSLEERKIPTPANSGSIHSERCEKLANVRND